MNTAKCVKEFASLMRQIERAHAEADEAIEFCKKKNQDEGAGWSTVQRYNRFHLLSLGFIEYTHPVLGGHVSVWVKLSGDQAVVAMENET